MLIVLTQIKVERKLRAITMTIHMVVDADSPERATAVANSDFKSAHVASRKQKKAEDKKAKIVVDKKCSSRTSRLSWHLIVWVVMQITIKNE